VEFSCESNSPENCFGGAYYRKEYRGPADRLNNASQLGCCCNSGRSKLVNYYSFGVSFVYEFYYV